MDKNEHLTITFMRFDENHNRGMFSVETDIRLIPLKVVVDTLREIADRVEEEIEDKGRLDARRN